MVIRFPAKKNAGCPKAPCISHQEKMAFSAPVGLSWDSPPPPTECVDGRTYGCTNVRTDGHMTITSQPKFLGLIGYHISLAMELRWRGLPAGSAIDLVHYHSDEFSGSRHNKTQNSSDVVEQLTYIAVCWIFAYRKANQNNISNNTTPL